MHLNPKSLSFALLISDLGSIARAANILGMKQATLSRKLTALESRVGVRLFDRSTRGAVPTVSGAGFLNQARRIVAECHHPLHEAASPFPDPGVMSAGYLH